MGCLAVKTVTPGDDVPACWGEDTVLMYGNTAFEESWPPGSVSVNHCGSCARGHEYYIRAAHAFKPNLQATIPIATHKDFTHLRDAAAGGNSLMLPLIF